MPRSRRKQGGGNGPAKLYIDGKVAKDGLGRPIYLPHPAKSPRNPLAARARRRAREMYFDELAKEREARELRRKAAMDFTEQRAEALGLGRVAIDHAQ